VLTFGFVLFRVVGATASRPQKGTSLSDPNGLQSIEKEERKEELQECKGER